MDSRKIPHGIEIDVEISKENDRELAILKIFGPNTKKECTLLGNKSKKHDLKFVKIIAEEVIKPMLDNFISGKGWINLVKTSQNKTTQKTHTNVCKVCNKVFCTEKNLTTHFEKYHLPKVVQFSCEICEFKTCDEGAFKKHNRDSHKQTFIFSCGVCEYQSVDKNLFKEHETDHAKDVESKKMEVEDHGDSDEECLDEKELNKTTQKTHTNVCKVCNKVFCSEKNLTTHLEKNHSPKVAQFSCDICEFKTCDEGAFKMHNRDSHKQTSIFKCDVCEYKSVDKNLFKEHERKDHTEDVESKKMQGDVSGNSDEECLDVEELKEQREFLQRMERSKLNDMKINEKKKKHEHEEKEYLERKKEENVTRQKDVLDNSNKKKVEKKKDKKLTNPKKKIEKILSNYPPNVTEVPACVDFLVGDEYLQYIVAPDGACAANCGAAHIFQDPKYGPEFRKVMNNHMADRWEYYRKKVFFPYVRQVGVKGNSVRFEMGEEIKFLEFLRSEESLEFQAKQMKVLL